MSYKFDFVMFIISYSRELRRNLDSYGSFTHSPLSSSLNKQQAVEQPRVRVWKNKATQVSLSRQLQNSYYQPFGYQQRVCASSG